MDRIKKIISSWFIAKGNYYIILPLIMFLVVLMSYGFVFDDTVGCGEPDGENNLNSNTENSADKKVNSWKSASFQNSNIEIGSDPDSDGVASDKDNCPSVTNVTQFDSDEKEIADGGTVFLDEVGEMSIEMQKKLLRFLQTGEFRRIGEDTTRKVDVRIISATNRDLKKCKNILHYASLYYTNPQHPR